MDIYDLKIRKIKIKRSPKAYLEFMLKNIKIDTYHGLINYCLNNNIIFQYESNYNNTCWFAYNMKEPYNLYINLSNNYNLDRMQADKLFIQYAQDNFNIKNVTVVHHSYL